MKKLMTIVLIAFSANILFAADAKISQLPAVSAPAGTDQFPVNQGGTTKRETLDQITSYVTSSVGTGGGAWGFITGTLSNQTDLNNALATKVTATTGGTKCLYGWDTVNQGCYSSFDLDESNNVFSGPTGTTLPASCNKGQYYSVCATGSTLCKFYLCVAPQLWGLVGSTPNYQAYDTFTDVNNTLLENHSADFAVTWTKMSWFSTGSMKISGNQATCADSNADGYYNSIAPSSANYSVQIDFTSGENMLANDSVNIMARVSSSQQTYYTGQYYNGSWYLLKLVNGVSTTLNGGSGWAQTWNAGVTHTAKLSVNGTTITLYVDGVSEISVTDSSISGAGYGGFSMGSSGTKPLADNFIIQ